MKRGEFPIPKIMTDSTKNLSSTFFSFEEMFAQNTRSEIFDVLYNPEFIDNMEQLLHILDKLRDSYQRPIYINSFYRDYEHNTRVGGVLNSKHRFGAAVDISSSDYPSLHTLVSRSKKTNWRFLPYPDQKFIHIELLNYAQ